MIPEEIPRVVAWLLLQLVAIASYKYSIGTASSSRAYVPNFFGATRPAVHSLAFLSISDRVPHRCRLQIADCTTRNVSTYVASTYAIRRQLKKRMSSHFGKFLGRLVYDDESTQKNQNFAYMYCTVEISRRGLGARRSLIPVVVGRRCRLPWYGPSHSESGKGRSLSSKQPYTTLHHVFF